MPYRPPGGPRPGGVFARTGGDEELFVSYFQQFGRAEAEIEPDVRDRLGGFYAALSAATMPAPGAPDPHFVGRGGTLRERYPVGPLPAWLGEGDLDFLAGEFERTGMAAALNRYRNMDRGWADLADHAGARSGGPRCSSAAARTPRSPGWPTRSRRTPRPCPVPTVRTSSTAAATSCGRAPGRGEPDPDRLARRPPRLICPADLPDRPSSTDRPRPTLPAPSFGPSAAPAHLRALA
ncbi:hypothetical protein M878_36980 [Streptomyces roseochromogenus subsp. oscitans DS 12.976]|uniref:Uncharacterized protein n=1 Tax=Streptomyces roseochromogenus subsp. oscitans DS 12.976 TaxID=1352936 RepID=V6JNH1_STRRC|nr:hypothetical protein M878_36980 [Streptomyces roseochromogenus subsp. oscitans DS 12.976]